MMKNLKKLTLSIFIFIFSLVNTLNVLTIASEPYHRFEDFNEAFLVDSEEDFNEENFDGLPSIVSEKDYNEEDFYEGEKFLGKINKRQEKKAKKRLAKNKEELSKLCQKVKCYGSKNLNDPIAQYILVCRNFHNLSISQRKHKKIKQILNGISLNFFGRNLKDKLVLKKFEKELISYLYSAALGLDFPEKFANLNILDAIFIYSYIFNAEGNSSNLEFIKRILINNGINPETFTPLG